MLAKVELRNAVLGLEKDANYAVDSPLRQSFRRWPAGRRGSVVHPGGHDAGILPHRGLSSCLRRLSNYAPRTPGQKVTTAT
jgi:hypothetical protein